METRPKLETIMFYLIIASLAVFLVVAEGVGINLFTVWNLLPLAIAVVVYLLARKRGKSLFGAYGFLLGSMLVSGLTHLAWMTDWNGTMSGSSTSALIFLFIPIYSVIAGLIGWLAGIGIGYRRTRPYVLSALMLCIGFIGYQMATQIRLEPKIARISQMKDAELAALLESDPDRENRYVLGAVASNPNASAATLMKIVSIDDSSLHEEYSCRGIVDLCGANKNSRAVMVQLAYHPNLDAEALPVLSKSPNATVLVGVARRHVASAEVLESIYQRRDASKQGIETALAANENTPSSIIKKLTYDPKAYGRTLKAIVGNSTVTGDVRQHALDRLNNCNYEIVDYPFTKCTPNAAAAKSNDKVVSKKRTRSGPTCYSHYRSKQFQKAFDSCLEEADQGKAYAQYNLAHLYRLGNGTDQDQSKAVEYYQLAADQDYGEAQFSLGIMYFQGAGIAKDMKKARYWWERSEKNGIASARVKKALDRIPR